MCPARTALLFRLDYVLYGNHSHRDMFMPSFKI